MKAAIVAAGHAVLDLQGMAGTLVQGTGIPAVVTGRRGMGHDVPVDPGDPVSGADLEDFRRKGKAGNEKAQERLSVGSYF